MLGDLIDAVSADGSLLQDLERLHRQGAGSYTPHAVAELVQQRCQQGSGRQLWADAVATLTSSDVQVGWIVQNHFMGRVGWGCHSMA